MTAVGYTSGDERKLNVAGGTMTGALVLAGAPTSSLHAATKAYVDGGGAASSVLVPTAVKTSAYAAAPLDFIPVDTTSGAVTITLPTAPANLSQVAVKHVIQGGTNTVTIACGGSDVMNKAGGGTTFTLSLLNQSVWLEYKATGGIWYVITADLPLSQLDLRYPINALNTTLTGAAVGGVVAASHVTGGSADAFVITDPGAALPAGLQAAGKLMPRFTGQQIHTAFASGHGFTITQGSTGGDNLNDTSDAILGTQSVKLVTDGAGTAKRLDKTSGIAIDLTERHPVLWVKVDNVAHLQAIEVWFCQSGGFGVGYRLSPWNSPDADGRLENLQVGQWCRLSFPFSTQTLVNTFGTPNRAAITTLRIQVQDDNTGNPVTVRVNGIGSMPEPRQVWPNGIATITFDDSYDNQYLVAKTKMDQYGLPGVAHTICNIIGTTGRMTVAQLRDMQNESGWQIAAHAYDIANHNAVGGFPSLDAATLFTEFRRMKQWAIDNGFQDAEHLAYPQGYFNDNVLRMAERFFTTSRSTISRTQETWPPAEPQKLRVRNILSTTTLGNLQAWVDDAYANAYWLILVFHSVDDTGLAGGNSITVSVFGQMIDYIAAKGIPVATTADVTAGRRLPRGAAAAMAPGRPNDLYLDGAQATTAGCETYNRLHATSGIPLTSQRVQITRFTPSRDRTISTLAFATGGTLGASLTLARLGLYLVNADDSMTLVAASLSDTAMATAASTWYSKALDTGGSLPASYTLLRGQRYAFAILIVGTTMPNVVGVIPAAPGLTVLAPNAGQFLSSQSDLPTTIATAGAGSTNNMPYGYLA